MGALGQFVDIPAMNTKGLKGPTNVDRIAADANGVLWISQKGGPMVPLLPVSADKQDMFKARAQSLISGPFSTCFVDYTGAQTDLGTAGFAATSNQAQVTGGRAAAGSQTLMTASGATGQHFETVNSQSINNGSSATQIQVGDVCSDQYYTEAGVTIKTFTGNAEIMIPMLWNSPSGNPANTDAGSSVFLCLEANGAVSSNFWTLKCNGSTVQTQITTIPIEFNTYRHIGWGCDGWGSIYTVRDGVVFDRFQQFSACAHAVGSLGRNERSNSGTLGYNIDYYAVAGMYF